MCAIINAWCHGCFTQWLFSSDLILPISLTLQENIYDKTNCTNCNSAEKVLNDTLSNRKKELQFIFLLCAIIFTVFLSVPHVTVFQCVIAFFSIDLLISILPQI